MNIILMNEMSKGSLIYLNIIRKITLLMFLIDISTYYGLKVEFKYEINTNQEYYISQIIECISFSLIFCDCSLCLFIIRKKTLLQISYIILVIFLSILCFVLKLVDKSETSVTALIVIKLILLIIVFMSFRHEFLFERLVLRSNKVSNNQVNTNSPSKFRVSIKNSENIPISLRKNIEEEITNKNQINRKAKNQDNNRYSVENNSNLIIYRIDQQIHSYFNDIIKLSEPNEEYHLSKSILMHDVKKKQNSIISSKDKPIFVNEVPEVSKISDNFEIENEQSSKKNLTEENIQSLQYHLANIKSSDFNVFEMNNACINNALYVSMAYFYYYYNAESELKINKTKYLNLAYNIQKK